MVRKIVKLLPHRMRKKVRHLLAIIKDILFAMKLNRDVKCIKNSKIVISLIKPELRILFYPEIPQRFYAIYKIVTLLGYRIVRDNKMNYDLVIKWQDATFTESLPQSLRSKPTINADCVNISKAFIARVFYEIFGYSLSVDPLRYDGLMVVKSNKNFAHDGQIIKGPLARVEKGKVYQMLIDNVDLDTGMAVDLRVPIFGNNIPIIWKKYKKVEERFGRNVIFREIASPHEVFTEDEIQKIVKTAQKMHLEYGEMDILRDGQTGKIYIVDVNSTPALDKTVAYFVHNDPYKAYTLMKSLCEGFVHLLRWKGIDV